MTLITPDEDVRAAEGTLRRTKEIYAELFEALKTLRARAQDGQIDVAKEVTELTTALSRSLRNLSDAEGRLDALRRKDAGIVNDFAIDLDEARAEIRRRLDRISGS